MEKSTDKETVTGKKMTENLISFSKKTIKYVDCLFTVMKVKLLLFAVV